MASVLFAVVAEGFDEGGDFQAVDVVAAALSLRFQHVASGFVGVGGDADGVFAFGCIVEWIDGCECGTYAVDVCSRRSG